MLVPHFDIFICPIKIANFEYNLMAYVRFVVKNCRKCYRQTFFRVHALFQDGLKLSFIYVIDDHRQ